MNKNRNISPVNFMVQWLKLIKEDKYLIEHLEKMWNLLYPILETNILLIVSKEDFNCIK